MKRKLLLTFILACYTVGVILAGILPLIQQINAGTFAETFDETRPVLRVPDLDICLPLEIAEIHSKNLQYLEDLPDCGVLMTCNDLPGITVISDHAAQGFHTLYRAQTGMTATIEWNNQSALFRIVGVDRNGTNTGKVRGFCYADGQTVWLSEADLILYTCNPGDGSSVTIITLEKI